MNETTNREIHDAKNQQKFDLYQLGKWGAIAIIAYYLLTEHRAHLVAYLPYLILLSCPLMHFFMHGNHGGRHHHSDEKEKEQR